MVKNYCIRKIDNRFTKKVSSYLYNSILMTFTDNPRFIETFDTKNEADEYCQYLNSKHKKLKLIVWPIM